mmetsp:Transcript_17368/g.21370  ORF Transcript_17368/g.21370 Transcript_17368/m.21370 type:complete len:162 (-) Transcript_17368:1586-2071(-)|eukprot:CAMPEP_0204884212 /NCGR_PEP_ID=MMETSP1349-20130617/9043_1 /ASSEMBLY_ACC=CAM_ASM_000710 /TAXON_ID=215587 /ORGANISM="Aplanochytrium stocchinoi, Strain GSBS06" /LENGTH=161 /DNA_ID=CAMNT_0052044871 /DNA_START=119 /DNA_END=604 /DNA_ORIENTATION=+
MSVVKGLSASKTEVSGQGLTIGIVNTRWNDKIINALKEGCKSELQRLHVKEIVELEVPGAYELPFAASQLIKKRSVDAVVCIGCLIKGETMHFEYICEAVSQGIMRLGIDSGIPVIFGVLTCMNDEQALARAGLIEGRSHNHGIEWGTTAVEMAQLREAHS